MRKRLSALTLVELLVVVLIVIVLTIFLLQFLARTIDRDPRGICKDNLSQIAKAIVAYNQNFNDYFPFVWGPATSEGAPSFLKPSPAATTACCDAATSLGCLYPQYLLVANIFRCPSMDDAPSFLMTAPYMTNGKPATASEDPYLFSQRTWSLAGASYGYDCRLSPSSASGHAIMADMDGSWQANHNTKTQNHDGGQNVLYVDGAVRWQMTNYVSNDVMDNIFAEGGDAKPGAAGSARVYWSADTDSFVVRGAMILGPSWQALCDDMQAAKELGASAPL